MRPFALLAVASALVFSGCDALDSIIDDAGINGSGKHPYDDSVNEADMTPSGTVLKVGETATIPLLGDKDGEKEQYFMRSAAMTVTAIEQGEASDLDDFDLTGENATMTPYFVHFTITKVSGEGHTNAYVGIASSFTKNFSLQSSGNVKQMEIFTGLAKFDKCPKPTGGFDDFENGETFTGCTIFLVTPESTVSGVKYDHNGVYVWEME